MTNITKEQVKHVAHLSRLTFSEEEVEQLAVELNDIIKYAEQLNELDTETIEPTTHVLEMKNIMRKDEPKEWITQEEALKNAPDAKDGQFRVPSILGD